MRHTSALCLQCRRKNATPLRVFVKGTQLIECYRDDAGVEHTEIYDIKKAPSWAKNLVRALLGHAPPGVRIFFVQSAHGRGGFYLAPNIVVIGWQDALAQLGKAQAEDPFVAVHLDTIIKQIAAHELGHYLRYLGVAVPLSLTSGLASAAPSGQEAHWVEEGCADYLGGRLQAACGWDCRLGTIASRAIGCNLADCDHPSSDWRGWSFEAGFRDEEAAAFWKDISQAMYLYSGRGNYNPRAVLPIYSGRGSYVPWPVVAR